MQRDVVEGGAKKKIPKEIKSEYKVILKTDHRSEKNLSEIPKEATEKIRQYKTETVYS